MTPSGQGEQLTEKKGFKLVVCFVNYIKKSKYDHSWWGNGVLAISNNSIARQKMLHQV